jgi:two-component system sensor histidine kinase KdpD
MIKAMAEKSLIRVATRIELLAEHPRLATAASLGLVALLVPLLRAWGGASGVPGQSLPLFFLLPVLLASALGGRGPGIGVSFVAVVVWDWFFIPPLYRVTVASARDLLALLVFLLVASLVGQLSTLARRRTQEATRRALVSEAVYDLSMSLIARQSADDLLTPLTDRLSAVFDLVACAVLLPDSAGHWHTAASAGVLPEDLRAEQNRGVAAIVQEAHDLGQERRLAALGLGDRRIGWTRRPRGSAARARFLPLRVGSRPVGVLQFVPAGGETLDEEREHLLATLANGAAIALEQARLGREEQAAAVARESDRLKSALLSSVSHDLRTPLAGIKAAASSLLQTDVQWSDADRQTFIADIDAEADRLARLVSNLLDVSRIEAGAMRPSKEWEDAGELAERVLARLRARLEPHPTHLAVADNLPLVRLDALQIEQVLVNLLENAAKYSPPEAPIRVAVSLEAGGAGSSLLRIAVRDEGVGITLGDQQRIFATFYRVGQTSRQVPGTGMGLAIVKGLVEAHGGQVRVHSSVGHGSEFVVELPADTAHNASIGRPRHGGRAG